MKIQSSWRIVALTAVFAINCNLAKAADKNAPENKPGYMKSKDVGAAAPTDADVPFDGTMKSVKENWEMWPKPDMAITWSIVDDPVDDGTTLMTNGGKRWGTHDLVTKKKYTDFEGHVEFVLMGNRNDDKVDGYSNSGVYLQNRYELQIESPKRQGCGRSVQLEDRSTRDRSILHGMRTRCKRVAAQRPMAILSRHLQSAEMGR